MNNAYFDYDYPSNLSKPVNSTATGQSMAAKNGASYGFSANPTSQTHFKTLFEEAKSFQKQTVQLKSIVPTPKTNSTTNMGCYYDVPKNIPVDPRFASNASTALTIPKFPVTKLSLNDRPALPEKSSVVLNKMSNYMNTTLPFQSSASENYQVPLESALLLTKQSASKPLPPLPPLPVSVAETRPIAINLPDETYAIAKSCDVVDGPSQYRYTDIYKTQNDNEDNDEENCDYDYDYVCLESKKKLDHEDANIKKLISPDLQFKYERLVLNSSGPNLQNLEKSLKNPSVLSPFVKKQFLQSYRVFLSICLKNFETWINLSLEVIQRNHLPNVYINFTKHILLSGQNLLLVAKSLNRHFGEMSNLSHFSDRFYDYLRQIVLKTKRAASEHPKANCTQDMVESIKSALQFTLHLNL